MLSFLKALLETGLPIFLFVSITEYLWRKKKYHKEFTRKFIHITIGSYAAFWPWFISWRNIELLAAGALCALVLSHIFNVYGSMHSARSQGTGEFLSTISLGLIAILTHNHWIFAAAMLHLSLGDGLAAVVGTKFGKGNDYKIFGQRKSLAGSLIFLSCSVIILAIYFSASHAPGAWPVMLWLPILTTGLENIGIYGSDNLLVPLAIVLALR